MTADIVAALHPPRLPEAFTVVGWDDVLAGFGFGLCLAALVLVLAAPLLRQRARRAPLGARIAEAESLPPEDRLLALARLLAERGGSLPADQREALYVGSGGDPVRVTALILATGRRR